MDDILPAVARGDQKIELCPVSGKPNMKKILSLFFVMLIVSSCATAPANVLPTVTIPPNIIMPTPASCTSITTAPTPGPDEPSVFPPINDKDHIQGAANPSFTVIDYIDYQDPRSALFSEVANRIVKEHPD